MQEFNDKESFLVSLTELMETRGIGVMDAITYIHEKSGIEMEVLAAIVKKLPEVKEMLYDDAKERRMVE